MTTTYSPSAIGNLNRYTKNRLLVACIIVVVAIGLDILFILLGRNQVKKYQSSILELKSQYLSAEGIGQLQSIVNQNPDAAQELIATFPQESTFPEVIAELEAVIGTIDPQGQVNFGSDKPVKESGELNIPLTAHFSGTASQVLDFMRQIEKLPYIIEITGIEMRSGGGVNAVSDCRVNLKVYVQDPFTQTK